ncbi:hypothetical protein JXA85_01335 [Candidatus Woesearchaeota archaeon]|nr:hypothetical protein [Candidatus Woesearchaeota archaeon]
MELKEAYAVLLKSKTYRDFKKQNPESYLTHAFIMFDGNEGSEWQFGFYLRKKDRLVTFFMFDEIKKSPESKIFKENKKILNELDLNKVKFNVNEALVKAKEIHKEKYSAHKVMKSIAILQSLGLGQVYNITMITNDFNTINLKLDSSTLEVKSENLCSILDFKAK